MFESTDGGNDWQPLNAGCVATFFPDPEPEFGHDPHCVRLHPLRPDRLYQQNHCGIYRMERPDGRWVRIGDNMPRDVGDIGFPDRAASARSRHRVGLPDGRHRRVAAHESRRATRRVRHARRRRVVDPRDTGLPERWFTVKRQAMTVDDGDPVGVYFGTTSGEIWASTDEGASWTRIAEHLPEIYSVERA